MNKADGTQHKPGMWTRRTNWIRKVPTPFLLSGLKLELETRKYGGTEGNTSAQTVSPEWGGKSADRQVD
jgi:hypothetical protein